MKLALSLMFIFICVRPSFADQETQPAQQALSPTEQPREYLPGEEVATPSGKKLKVWSTRGAVAVNKVPEPFKENSLPGDLNVVIDGRGVERHQDQETGPK